MYDSPKQFVSIVWVPFHECCDLHEEQFAGSLLWLTTPFGRSTPGKRISFTSLTGTKRKDLGLLIDQNLHVFCIGKLCEASRVHIEFVVIECHSWFKSVSEEFSSYNLKSVKVESITEFNDLVMLLLSFPARCVIHSLRIWCIHNFEQLRKDLLVCNLTHPCCPPS